MARTSCVLCLHFQILVWPECDYKLHLVYLIYLWNVITLPPTSTVKRIDGSLGKRFTTDEYDSWRERWKIPILWRWRNPGPWLTCTNMFAGRQCFVRVFTFSFWSLAKVDIFTVENIFSVVQQTYGLRTVILRKRQLLPLLRKRFAVLLNKNFEVVLWPWCFHFKKVYLMKKTINRVGVKSVFVVQ